MIRCVHMWHLLLSKNISRRPCRHLSVRPLLPSQVTTEGTFLDVRTIGRFCYEDDLLTLSAVYTEAQAESQPGFPRLYTDKTINSLKHRLLVYLWRRAEQDGSATAKRRYRATEPHTLCFGFLCYFSREPRPRGMQNLNKSSNTKYCDQTKGIIICPNKKQIIQFYKTDKGLQQCLFFWSELI